MRRARWAMVTVLALISIACGGGTDEGKAGAGGGAAGAAGGGQGGQGGNAMCGNGVVESVMGEQCEGAVPVTMTCSGLGLGPGMVMCNPASCRLMQMCQMVQPVAGSDGSSGVAGTGGLAGTGG